MVELWLAWLAKRGKRKANYSLRRALRSRFALRAKCRVRLARLLKRLLCRLNLGRRKQNDSTCLVSTRGRGVRFYTFKEYGRE